jgi:hypothetical protein
VRVVGIGAGVPLRALPRLRVADPGDVVYAGD